MPIALSERDPTVAPEQVLAALVPPPTFAEVSLDSFRPDPTVPSQAEAVARVRSSAATSGSSASNGAGARRRWFGRGRSRAAQPGRGLYLDGGFGAEQSPDGLDSIADLQKLDGILTKRGYSDDDVAIILGGNWIRFFEQHLP